MNFLNFMVLLLFNFKVISTDFASPCPHIFRYALDGQSESNALYGILTVPFPIDPPHQLNILIRLSMLNEPRKVTKSWVQLLTPQSELIKIIEDRGFLTYRINLPHWIDGYYPKILLIEVNQVEFCSGMPYTIQSGIHYKHKILYKFTFNIDPALLPSIKPTSKPPVHTTTPQARWVTVTTPRTIDTSIDTRIAVTSSQPVYNTNIDNILYHSPYQHLVDCRNHLTIEALIVGGIPSSIEFDHPWLGALFRRLGTTFKFQCEVNLITNRHAITAAHCVSGVRTKNLNVAFGKEDLNNPFSGTHSRAKDIIKHRDYQIFKSDADLAIIVLMDEIGFTNKISPICLWEGDRNNVGTIGTVAGWGENKDGIVMSTPSKVNLAIVDYQECLRSSYALASLTSNRTFCAGFRNNSGPCKGDSGAALAVTRNNIPYLAGLVSHSVRKTDDSVGTHSCNLSQYVVFVDVTKHVPWIIHTIINNS